MDSFGDLSKHVRRSLVESQYPAWVRCNRLGPREIRLMKAEAEDFHHRPKISVLLPAYNSRPEWLEQALDSMLAQTYPEWELCVCDDASPENSTRKVLSRYAHIDDRIRPRFLEENTGISGATNAALSIAEGEFVALLDHDDELPPDALFEVVKLLQTEPDTDLIYSDVDKIDENGSRFGPHFKPGWSPELLLSTNYISHLGVYRREIVEEIGGFRPEFDGCQDYDLVLRFTERTDRVRHIPRVLYHWRAVEGSLARGSENKSYIAERARQALAEALERRGVAGSVEDGKLPNRFRVIPDIRGNPRVSIVVSGHEGAPDQWRCLESVENATEYANYEIAVVGNAEGSASGAPDNPPVYQAVPSAPNTAPYAAFNLGARESSGEYLLFLHGKAETISEEWLEALLQQAQNPEVGAVGARLLYPDGRVWHAGVLTGSGDPWGPAVAAHSHCFYTPGSSGYAGYASVIRNYSAVSGACLMLRRSVFEEVGGFDSDNLPSAYADVDLCLRLGELGYRMVYTPYAELYLHEEPEGLRRAGESQTRYMRERWGSKLDRDPFYNPNFSTGAGDFNLRADMLRPSALRVAFQSLPQDRNAGSTEPSKPGEAWARGSPGHSLIPELNRSRTPPE